MKPITKLSKEQKDQINKKYKMLTQRLEKLTPVAHYSENEANELYNFAPSKAIHNNEHNREIDQLVTISLMQIIPTEQQSQIVYVDDNNKEFDFLTIEKIKILKTARLLLSMQQIGINTGKQSKENNNIVDLTSAEPIKATIQQKRNQTKVNKNTKHLSKHFDDLKGAILLVLEYYQNNNRKIGTINTTDHKLVKATKRPYVDQYDFFLKAYVKKQITIDGFTLTNGTLPVISGYTRETEHIDYNNKFIKSKGALLDLMRIVDNNELESAISDISKDLTQEQLNGATYHTFNGNITITALYPMYLLNGVWGHTALAYDIEQQLRTKQMEDRVKMVATATATGDITDDIDGGIKTLIHLDFENRIRAAIIEHIEEQQQLSENEKDVLKLRYVNFEKETILTSSELKTINNLKSRKKEIINNIEEQIRHIVVFHCEYAGANN